jgi:hypothetical protein
MVICPYKYRQKGKEPGITSGYYNPHLRKTEDGESPFQGRPRLRTGQDEAPPGPGPASAGPPNRLRRGRNGSAGGKRLRRTGAATAELGKQDENPG